MTEAENHHQFTSEQYGAQIAGVVCREWNTR